MNPQAQTLEHPPLDLVTLTLTQAIASAIPSNRSLTELKLRNLHGRTSKEAEEALAASLEHCPQLMKLSIDLKTQHTKDLVRRYLARNEQTRREERGWNSNARQADKFGGGLWAADWKPPVASSSSTKLPPKVRDSGLGKHVAIARAKWDGFLTGEASASASDVASSVLFEPSSLPEVELPTEKNGILAGGGGGGAGSDKGKAGRPSKPFVSLGEIQKAAKGLSSKGGLSSNRAAGRTKLDSGRPNQASKGGSGKGGSSGKGGVASALSVDIASAAARREESMSSAVAAIEKKRAAINKNNLAKSNPIADAVVEAAKERGEDILEAVAELQERKAAQEKRDSVLKVCMHACMHTVMLHACMHAVMHARTHVLTHVCMY